MMLKLNSFTLNYNKMFNFLMKGVCMSSENFKDICSNIFLLKFVQSDLAVASASTVELQGVIIWNQHCFHLQELIHN